MALRDGKTLAGLRIPRLAATPADYCSAEEQKRRTIPAGGTSWLGRARRGGWRSETDVLGKDDGGRKWSVSYTHLRAHETVLDLVCRLLPEKTK